MTDTTALEVPVGGRRTQAARKAATIARLIESTIDALVEVGYSATSTAEVCRRSGVSAGGLFRHFGSRIDLVGATTDEIGRRHLERFAEAASGFNVAADPIRELVCFCRDACRDRVSAAWHEVMVAARTDADLRAAVHGPLRRFEAGLMASASQLFPKASPERAATLVLSILHMFDSEAVTTVVLANPTIEAARVEMVTEWIRAELAR